MLAGQGGADHPCSKGGGCQEDVGDADGGGDEEVQDSPVDGVLGRPRLGKERRLVWFYDCVFVNELEL